MAWCVDVGDRLRDGVRTVGLEEGTSLGKEEEVNPVECPSLSWDWSFLRVGNSWSFAGERLGSKEGMRQSWVQQRQRPVGIASLSSSDLTPSASRRLPKVRLGLCGHGSRSLLTFIKLL